MAPSFSPSADYYVIRQSDDMMEVLNATLVGSPDRSVVVSSE